jgi:threonine/homoserine/homoserine lactone efflux protein
VADAESSRVVNALELTLGVLLLVLAAGQALGRAGPDSPPPGWMAAVERLGPGRAYAFGVLVESTNVKRLAIYLAGLSEISRSDVSTRQSVAALALFVLLLLGGVLAPIAVYAASPERSAAMLGATRAWLLTHNRRILAVLFALVGTVLIERGLAGLV